LSTTTLALRQYEAEMDDLVRAKTEIECLIEDYKQAGENGEQRRAQVAQDLEQLETRIGDATDRLTGLSEELEQCVVVEREAKEA
jgi:structural maintenance of chromosome 3 (chondroitin sulfate proteoglycan 6)